MYKQYSEWQCWLEIYAWFVGLQKSETLTLELSSVISLDGFPRELLLESVCQDFSMFPDIHVNCNDFCLFYFPNSSKSQGSLQPLSTPGTCNCPRTGIAWRPHHDLAVTLDTQIDLDAERNYDGNDILQRCPTKENTSRTKVKGKLMSGFSTLMHLGNLVDASRIFFINQPFGVKFVDF
jgi:hypothetical protein